MPEKIVLSWSGGKDSALALYHLQRSGTYEVHSLLVTLTEGYDRVSMHGVRRALLEQQARALGLPVQPVFIPRNGSNEEYEAQMREALDSAKEAGASSVAFGDIYLEEVRRYREEKLMSKAGMRGLFPLWGRDTRELAHSFIGLGLRAVITCVDSRALGPEFAGCELDEEFLARLPSGVDPCGENGEFHSFVYDGPLFKERVRFERGEIVLREERFYYCDLLPQEAPASRHEPG